MSAVELRAVSKSYGPVLVLDDVDLTVGDHSFTAVLGPSGSGKTTMLRLIAGFERVDAGAVSIGGRVVDDGRVRVRPESRGIGYVPQEGALFPHLTAAGNVGFGLARRDRGRVDALLELVGLGGLGRRYPHQLSGGQQQRVALARALAIEPALVLLDEPFSSLDASLRASVRRDVARVLAETGTPTVIVTHDQDEALSLADQVVIVDGGRVVGRGTPSALYDSPAGPDAARFLGDANLLPGTADATSARCALGRLTLRESPDVTDGPVTVFVRPEQVVVRSGPDAAGVAATVRGIDYYGHDSVVELVLADANALTARVVGRRELRVGDIVRVGVDGDVVAWPST